MEQDKKKRKKKVMNLLVTNVEDEDKPMEKVGTMTRAQRKAAAT